MENQICYVIILTWIQILHWLHENKELPLKKQRERERKMWNKRVENWTYFAQFNAIWNSFQRKPFINARVKSKNLWNDETTAQLHSIYETVSDFDPMIVVVFVEVRYLSLGICAALCISYTLKGMALISSASTIENFHWPFLFRLLNHWIQLIDALYAYAWHVCFVHILI